MVLEIIRFPQEAPSRAQHTTFRWCIVAPLLRKGFPSYPPFHAFHNNFFHARLGKCLFQNVHHIIVRQHFRPYQETFQYSPSGKSRCVRSLRVSCFIWCSSIFSSCCARCSLASPLASSRLSFSSFSFISAALLLGEQRVNAVRFSHTPAHPQDQPVVLQFFQGTLDGHGAAGQGRSASSTMGKQTKSINFLRLIAFDLVIYPVIF